MGSEAVDEKALAGEFVVLREYRITDPELSGVWKVLDQSVVTRADGLMVVACKIQNKEGLVSVVLSNMLKKVNR